MQSGVVYNFSCECEKEYVGETSRALRKRVLEHHSYKKDAVTAVYNHVYLDKCLTYHKYLFDNFGSQPRKSIEISFFEKHFKILKRNLHNYRIRTDMEAVIIRLRQPDLNNQVPHKKVLLI